MVLRFMGIFLGLRLLWDLLFRVWVIEYSGFFLRCIWGFYFNFFESLNLKYRIFFGYFNVF